MVRLSLSLALVLALAVAGGTSAEVRSFSLLEHGHFEIDLPEGWHLTVLDGDASSPPAIRIVPKGAVPLVLLITPIPVAEQDKDLTAAMQETASEILRRMREVAVEDQLELSELEGPNCRGLHVSATDRTVKVPTSENFKYATQGAVVVGRVLMTFTLLTNVPDAPERAAAIEVVRSAHHRPREE